MRALIFLIGFLLPLSNALQSLWLPSQYASSMVLQRDAPINIMGKASPGQVVSVSLMNESCEATADDDSWWACAVPSQPATSTSFNLTISSSSGENIILSDVLIGDVFFCSGQSNMYLQVPQTVNGPEEVKNSSLWSQILRGILVQTDESYFNVSEAQIDVLTFVPWTRVTPESTPYFSALCYYHAVELLKASINSGSETVPIGMICSSWGGTTIQPWMPEEAVSQCASQGHNARPPWMQSGKNPDPGSIGGLSSTGRSISAARRPRQDTKNDFEMEDCIVPCLDSTLYNSMVSPFTYLPVAGWLWYQGESNVGSAESYACQFPAMIEWWRQLWMKNTGGAQSSIAHQPFIFVQLSSWPNNDDNLNIPLLRESQDAALELDDVAMAVAADIGDPAGPFHPIHPPYKQELSRRVALQTRRIQSQNKSIPASGPRVVSVAVDPWTEDWGDYHYGYGGDGNNQCTFVSCLGLRVKFDQPVFLRETFGLQFGFGDGGFEIMSAIEGNDCDRQPAALTGVRADDAFTVQLNITWIYGSTPLSLRYAWKDYPNMPLTNGAPYDLPAPPFRIALS